MHNVRARAALDQLRTDLAPVAAQLDALLSNGIRAGQLDDTAEVVAWLGTLERLAAALDRSLATADTTPAQRPDAAAVVGARLGVVR